MRISDWSSTCALPIYRDVARHEKIMRIGLGVQFNPIHFKLCGAFDHPKNRIDKYRDANVKTADLLYYLLQKFSIRHRIPPGIGRDRIRFLRDKRSEKSRGGKECVSTCRHRWGS